MRIPRIYSEKTLIPGESLELDGAASKHVLRVLRLKPGDALTLFNGDGLDVAAQITNVDRHHAIVHLDQAKERHTESPLQVTLNQAVGRGERMDYSIQKAVELGVAAIRPVFTERTVVNLSGERLSKRMAHWQGVIIAASEQSGRAKLPRLLDAAKIQHLSQPAERLRLVLDPQAEIDLIDLEPPEAELDLLIGPEGGLSDEELAQLADSGWQGIRLGPRILRTETAGVAAVAVMQSLWGDL